MWQTLRIRKTNKLKLFKVDLNNSFKCISATLGCENVGLSLAEINK